MEDFAAVASRLLVSVCAGAIIGLERAYTGRPAGLRTHTLVCTSSCLLMLFTVYQWELLAFVPSSTLADTVRVDPTRMAQGIMTGIGFLGAGVIMKEKLSIRGLTTAASVWMTASLGIILGMGFYSAGLLATCITLVVLNGLGWLEKKLPTRSYCRLIMRFKSRRVLKRLEIQDLVRQFNIRGSNPSYQLEDEGHFLEYRLNIYTIDSDNFQKLAEHLTTLDEIHEFSIMPTGD